MTQQEGKLEDDPLSACPASPMAPGKAVVSGKAFVQNWEDCLRKAEQEALQGWRTYESAAGVLERQEWGAAGTRLGHQETHAATAAHT